MDSFFFWVFYLEEKSRRKNLWLNLNKAGSSSADILSRAFPYGWIIDRFCSIWRNVYSFHTSGSSCVSLFTTVHFQPSNRVGCKPSGPGALCGLTSKVSVKISPLSSGFKYVVYWIPLSAIVMAAEAEDKLNYWLIISLYLWRLRKGVYLALYIASLTPRLLEVNWGNMWLHLSKLFHPQLPRKFYLGLLQAHVLELDKPV